MASNRFSRLLKIFTGTSSGEDGELLQLDGRLERTAHFWTLVVRHFVRNRCLVRASSLAYTTLLALIPLLAVILSVSTSLLKNVDEEKFYQAIASVASASTLKVKPDAANSNSVVVVNTNLAAGNFSGTETGTNAVATNSIVSAETQVTVQKEIARWLSDFVWRAL